MPPILTLVINAITSFVVLFFLAKLLGRKQIAGLDFIDYVIGITIGSIAGQWATSSDQFGYYYLIALLIFFSFSIIYALLESSHPFMKELLKGRPLILIDNGKIFYPNLKKSKLSVNDVLGLCRTQGYFDLNDIAYAIFETSGELSIMPKANKKPIVASDIKGVNLQRALLTHYIVMDGLLNLQALENINRDEEWLLKRLKVKNKRNLRNIILASYDKTTDEIKVHYKYVTKRKTIF